MFHVEQTKTTTMKKTRKYKANDGKVIEILADHVETVSGNFNGVCVSACLSYLGIHPNDYKYTWSKTSYNECAIRIMRRFGFNVRSRKTAFLRKPKTVSQLLKEIRKYKDVQQNVYYYVKVDRHVLLVDSKGNVLVDTSPRKRDRRKVMMVRAVFK